ncbi:MAG: hypothetical protein AB7D34_08025 [Sulfurimonas sp.]
MADKQTKLIPEFMLTEKGQYAKFRFSAILGIKFNHQNPLGHTLLVQVQNTNTKFVEKHEIAFDLIRYRYKIGKVYQKGKLVEDDIYQTLKFKFEIDTSNLTQLPIYQCLNKANITYILGDSTFNSFAFGGNNCYQYETDEVTIVIPSSAVLLYYYMRSSSMKNALLRGDYRMMYDHELSDLKNKEDAQLVLNRGYSLLDGPFIYRFVTDNHAGKGFTDIFNYISAVKLKNDMVKKTTDIIPIKALFPTKERFIIKIRYIELPEQTSSGKKIFYAQEILTDASSLDFEKLTISKITKKRDDNNEEQKPFIVKGKKPRNYTGKTNNKTPSKTYSTRHLQKSEEEKNLALYGKTVQYSIIEEIDISEVQGLSESSNEPVDTSFVKSENNGDDNTQGSSFEANQKKKQHIKRYPNFEIFKTCIEYLENTGLVSNFEFDETCIDIPYEAMKNGELYSRCSIDGEVKQFTTCFFVFNDLNIALVEVESENADFATWVLSSMNVISDGQIWKILKKRYQSNHKISELKDYYNDIEIVKFDIKKHPIVDLDGEIDEAILESWTLTLLSKIIFN